MFELKEVTCITAQSVTTGISNAFLKNVDKEAYHVLCIFNFSFLQELFSLLIFHFEFLQ